jgi:NADPH-dependent curcumin reductase CurA
MTTYQRIVLASRPNGDVTLDNFRLENVPVPEIADGQVLVRVHFLSLDPYMRGRMDDNESYASPQPLDEVMIGGTVGEVVASRDPRYARGDKVLGLLGWQEMGAVNGDVLRKIDTTRIPMASYLGAVGMPGITAWYGLNGILKPAAGQTVVVSAASGAVGSVVGQLASAMGCRVVGIAGGKGKCDYVIHSLGFDACIDYKSAVTSDALYAMLVDATPDGVDGYFDNVGGEILDAVLRRMNAFGRIAVCGQISRFGKGRTPLLHVEQILLSRLKVEGFIVSEHADAWPRALQALGNAVAEGTLKFRESIAHGLDRAPEAFIGLLKGKNLGKQLVKLV